MQRGRGIPERSRASEGGKRTGDPHAGQAGDPADPCVGRESELGELTGCLEAALESRGRVVFLAGQRGIGKSTLAAEFLRRVRRSDPPVTVVAVGCVDRLGPREAFLPFLDGMRKLLGGRGRRRSLELLSSYAPTIAGLFPPGLVPDPTGDLHRRALGATRERFIREAGDFMEASTRDFPVVLLIEDLQWAEEATVEMLLEMGRRSPHQRLLLIGTFRDEDVEASDAPVRRAATDLAAAGTAVRLTLGPLGPDDVQAWLDARLAPHDLPAGLAALLHGRAEGHPLFVRGLLELLLARGDIRRRDGSWQLAAPLESLDLAPGGELAGLVRRHVEALPELDRELIRKASVAGPEFLSSLVCALVGGDELEAEDRLDRLARVHRLLERRGEEELPDGSLATRYRFAHAIYLRVLYEDLLPARRVRLHRQVAEWLRGHFQEDISRHAVEIADHYERARDIASAVAFRQHAGDAAAARFALVEAEQQYDWALRLLERLPRDARAWPAQALYERRGRVAHERARFDAAVADFRQVLTAAREAGSASAECAALNLLSDSLFYARRMDEMAVAVFEGLEAAARAGGSRRLTEARARAAQALLCEGRLSEATPVLERVVDAAHRRGPREALLLGVTLRGFVHYWRSEYERAEVLFSEALSLATDLNSGFEALAAWLFLGLSRVNLGRTAQALADFDAARSVAQRNGDRFWVSRLIANAGWVHDELQDPMRARELFEQALEVRDRPEAWAPGMEALLGLARATAAAGDAAGAGRFLAEAEGLSARDAWFRWMHEAELETAAGEVGLLLGEPGVAQERATRLLEIAGRLGSRSYRCTAERLRGEACLLAGGDLEDCAARLAEAARALEGHPAPLVAWKAALTSCRLERRLGRSRRADAQQRLAASAARQIAAGAPPELRSRFLAAEPIVALLGREGEP